MSFSRLLTNPIHLALAGFTLLLAGCGQTSPTGTVRGMAMLNGQPYSNAALILLHKESGDGANVDLEPDGSFKVAVPLKTGAYTVYLAPKAAGSTDEPAPVSIDTSVPDAYWSEATSSLQVNVNPGDNEVKVEMVK